MRYAEGTARWDFLRAPSDGLRAINAGVLQKTFPRFTHPTIHEPHVGWVKRAKSAARKPTIDRA